MNFLNRTPGGKTVYPAGYKRMAGSLGKKTGTYNLPTGVIPLTLLVYPWDSGTDGGFTGGTYYVKDNTNKQYIFQQGNYQASIGQTMYLNIANYYAYDFELMKLITAFTMAYSGKAPTIPYIEVVEWLQPL